MAHSKNFLTRVPSHHEFRSSTCHLHLAKQRCASGALLWCQYIELMLFNVTPYHFSVVPHIRNNYRPSFEKFAAAVAALHTKKLGVVLFNAVSAPLIKTSSCTQKLPEAKLNALSNELSRDAL